MEKPKGMPKPKKMYYIMLEGRCVGRSMAVSSAKAVSNWWWKNIKGESEFSPRYYAPDDFDAVEAKR